MSEKTNLSQFKILCRNNIMYIYPFKVKIYIYLIKLYLSAWQQCSTPPGISK